MPDESERFELDLDELDRLISLPADGVSEHLTELRVYLASALTGLSDNQQSEAQIVRSSIRELLDGLVCDGHLLRVYDPGDNTPPGSNHSNEDVYKTDYRETSRADLVLFYVASPSLGVGMEAQICADFALPRVVV